MAQITGGRSFKMCKTCNGEGGLAVTHYWGVEFIPCPDSKCDFDKEKAQKEIFKELDRLMQEVTV